MFAFQNNRRNQPRAPVRLPAHVVWPGGETDTYLLLISEGGCFMPLSHAPAMLSRLKVSFDIPGRGPHSAEVEVRYASEMSDYKGGKDVPGVGCRFTLISPTAKQAIRDLVTQVKKSYSQIQFALAISKPNPQLPSMLEKAQLPSMKDPRELRDAVQWGLKQMGT